MGFLSRFREKTQRLTLPLLLAAAGSVGVASAARAADVVNLGAARVAGAQGSDWHDRQLVKDRGNGSSFTVYVTPRGQAFSPSDPSVSMVLQPDETRTIDDLYAQLVGEGAGTIRIVPDAGSDAPLWRSMVYSKDGASEFGMALRPFSEENDGYYRNSTLAVMLSPAGFRDNIDLITGADGVAGTWRYTNSAGANEVRIDQSYAANTTQQFSASTLLGFEPELGSSLEFTITDGSTRLYLARNNNESNDPSRDEFEVTSTTPQSDYDISVKIYVSDNDVPRVFSETTPSDEIIKKVWQVNTIPPLEGLHEYTCDDLPDGAVNSLPEVIANYNDRLTPEEQQAFSGDRNGFAPFVNDGDNDGLPCDEDEPDHQYVYMVRLDVQSR